MVSVYRDHAPDRTARESAFWENWERSACWTGLEQSQFPKTVFEEGSRPRTQTFVPSNPGPAPCRWVVSDLEWRGLRRYLLIRRPLNVAAVPLPCSPFARRHRQVLNAIEHSPGQDSLQNCSRSEERR